MEVETETMVEKREIINNVMCLLTDPNGTPLGSPMYLPQNAGPQHLNQIVNKLQNNEEKLSYAFYISDEELIEPLETYLQKNKGHAEVVLSVAFSPDGRQLASGSGDTSVRFWDLTTHTPLYTCKGNVDCPHTHLRISPGVLMGQAIEKQMHFGDMSSQINPFKISFNCIVPYLYSLQIPLISVYVRFIHVTLPLKAARSRSLSCAPCTMTLAPASLPALVSVPECHMPTSFRLVRPRNTPYWERLGSDTICNVPATYREHRLPPHITTRLSDVFCPHSHKVTHPRIIFTYHIILL
ncbi:hypothetical protein VIGAN_08270000 [Vigna angularis var. angularis]|uniref:NLE domain-containing protein n=1 Tax=Vigna angularis var. angularis TaxID=157739 RepID=A0A0S3SST6_PHAAN|nr:hypothetical protein VIGAN_08270000 [Vigna angularis var. angularis]